MINSGSRVPIPPARNHGRIGSVNVYDVMHVNGNSYEVEADFFERADADYVFYSGQHEVLRLPWVDVVTIVKGRALAPQEPPHSRLWL